MIKRMIRNIVNWAQRDQYCESSKTPSPLVGKRGQLTLSSDIDQVNSLNFKVYNAIGGTIVQTSRYDENKDKIYSTLYIITSEQDIGEEIGMIITKEKLSR